MDYVITNNKKIYIKLDKNGTPQTCSKSLAQRFSYNKAMNILDHIPKQMKKFHFNVKAIPEIPEKKEKNIGTKEKQDKCHILSKLVGKFLKRGLHFLRELHIILNIPYV